MRFADGQFHAKFGCNSFNGRYKMKGSTVEVLEVIQTAAGCAEPAMTFERLDDAILSAPMQIGMDPETRRPVLFNGQGRINLVPKPPVTSPDLQGTWNVDEINGIATLGGQSFRVRFTSNQVDGRFGCNNYRASYRIEADTFVSLGWQTTEMACELPDPHQLPVSLMEMEKQAFAVLRSRPEIALGSNARVALVSSAGRIDLSRR